MKIPDKGILGALFYFHRKIAGGRELKKPPRGALAFIAIQSVVVSIFIYDNFFNPKWMKQQDLRRWLEPEKKPFIEKTPSILKKELLDDPTTDWIEATPWPETLPSQN